ncbi:hypothetical protein EVAR_86227_1 [Eumeta japonica]|uniref:Uncharacterized protein n=1 Tax=Eumeta variegata TaxID=151549 RepID=A0A4C1UCJ4_EUMVA|nr:hypothetical protein EVAR_86227_1 [Eumeta japonica]
MNVPIQLVAGSRYTQVRQLKQKYKTTVDQVCQKEIENFPNSRAQRATVYFHTRPSTKTLKFFSLTGVFVLPRPPRRAPGAGRRPAQFAGLSHPAVRVRRYQNP